MTYYTTFLVSLTSSLLSPISSFVRHHFTLIMLITGYSFIFVCHFSQIYPVDSSSYFLLILWSEISFTHQLKCFRNFVYIFIFLFWCNYLSFCVNSPYFLSVIKYDSHLIWLSDRSSDHFINCLAII